MSLDERVWVPDGATIMSNQIGNSSRASRNLNNTTELIFSFLRGDLVEDEATLDIVQDSEIVICLFDGQDIHEAGRIFNVSADATIDFDETLHDNLGYFTSSKGVLELIPENKHHWKRFAEPVRTGSGTGSEHTSQLVQHP